MFKKKKFMAYLATVLLLVVSMIMTACGGPADTKKDAAQSGKQIEITDVTGQKVTLKKPAERVVVQLSASGGAFLTMAALQGKDVAKTIVGIDPYLSKLRTDMWDRYKSEVPELEKIPLIGNVNDKSPATYVSCIGVNNSQCKLYSNGCIYSITPFFEYFYSGFGS